MAEGKSEFRAKMVWGSVKDEGTMKIEGGGKNFLSTPTSPLSMPNRRRRYQLWGCSGGGVCRC